MESRARMGAQALATFVVVASLYAGPLVLSALLGLVDDFEATDDLWVETRDTSREAVFWVPPQPEDDAVVDAVDVPDTSTEPESTPSEPDAPEPAQPTPVDEADVEPVRPPVDSLASAAGGGVVREQPASRELSAAAIRNARERHRVVAGSGQTSRPRRVRPKRPPLTDKQLRERARRAKRRERMAERKQCAELIDQLVKVEENSWWVGRELINCYRAHPQQFVMMGGAWWNEVDGKKRGVRIHVSSRPRGDVARAAGFQRKDVVRSVNGVPIRSDFTGALAATQLLRGHGRVKIERGDEKLVLRYKVVGLGKLEEKRLELAALAALADEDEANRRPRRDRSPRSRD